MPHRTTGGSTRFVQKQKVVGLGVSRDEARTFTGVSKGRQGKAGQQLRTDWVGSWQPVLG